MMQNLPPTSGLPLEDDTVLGKGYSTDPGVSDSDVPLVVGGSKVVTVITSMPEDYLLPNALVFALFGKLSDGAVRYYDLDLTTSDGPPGRKKLSGVANGKGANRFSAESCGSKSSGEGKLSSRGLITLIVGAGESQSRAESKESTRKIFNETNGDSLKRKLCDMLERPNLQRADINERVEKMCKTFDRDSKLREVKAEIEAAAQGQNAAAQGRRKHGASERDQGVSAAGPVHQDTPAEGLPLIGAGGVHEGLSDGGGDAAAGFAGAPHPGCINVWSSRDSHCISGARGL